MHYHAPFAYTQPPVMIKAPHIPCQVQSLALRHKNLPPKGGSDDPDKPDTPDNPTKPDKPTPTPPSDATLVPMEYLKNEDDEIFVPRTHTKAVQNAEGVVLDDMLVNYETRINALEQGIAPAIKVADNLLTDAASIALSARQGKYLNEHFTGILEHEDGDVQSDGERLLIKEGAVLGSHIAEDSITTEHLTEDCVSTTAIQNGAVTSDKLALTSISKPHLDEDLQIIISNVENMTEWCELTDMRIKRLQEQMAEHIATDALLKEQNLFLLNEHQKMKRLDVIASIYNATTGLNVQDSISWEDVRMSGLQINYKWRYWDEIDGKDYTPVSFKIEAIIKRGLQGDVNGDGEVTQADADAVAAALAVNSTDKKYDVNYSGNVSIADLTTVNDIVNGVVEPLPAIDKVVVLSTDKGLNNLPQTLRLLNVEKGSTVTIRTTVNYCWLDWTHSYNISITA